MTAFKISLCHPRRRPGPSAPLPPAAARSARSIPGAAAAHPQPPAGLSRPARAPPALAAARRGKRPGLVQSPGQDTPLPARASPGGKGLSLRQRWQEDVVQRFHPTSGRVSPSLSTASQGQRTKPVCAFRLEYSLSKVFSGRDRGGGLGRTCEGPSARATELWGGFVCLFLADSFGSVFLFFVCLFACLLYVCFSGGSVGPVPVFGGPRRGAAPQAGACPGAGRGRPLALPAWAAAGRGEGAICPARGCKQRWASQVKKFKNM